MREEAPKTFLEELQALSEPTKFKVLVVATIMVMAVVLYLWLGYFNAIVADNQPQQNSAGPGFAQNVKAGMAAIVSDFANIPHWIAGLFQNPKQYTIHPSK